MAQTAESNETDPLLSLSQNKIANSAQQNFFDDLYLKILDLLKNFLCFSYVWHSPDEVDTSCLEEFKHFVSPAYDSKNQEHEQLLSLLWQYSYPEENLINRRSRQWSSLGFQGLDPATDFRGVGVFGLQNILYFAEKYPQQFRSMLQGRWPMESYPFAISGLNMTMMLFELMGIGLKSKLRGEKSYYASRRSMCRILFPKQTGDSNLITEDNNDYKKTFVIAFSELYCLGFMMLDEEWYRCKASYMDFPKVFDTVSKQIESVIANLKTVTEVTNYTRSRFNIA